MRSFAIAVMFVVLVSISAFGQGYYPPSGGGGGGGLPETPLSIVHGGTGLSTVDPDPEVLLGSNGSTLRYINPHAEQAAYNYLGISLTLPSSICAGPDGNLWVAESGTNKVARVTPLGVVTEFPTTSSPSGPYWVCVGGDGNIWFTENTANKIGKMSTSGTMLAEYSIPSANCNASNTCLGPDGNVWFTEQASNKVAKITTSGSITEYSLTTAASTPTGICSGPDGKLWVTEATANKVAKVTTSGAVTEYSTPTGGSAPIDICSGPDGNLWVVYNGFGDIAKLTTSGVFTEYIIGGINQNSICVGSDNNLWISSLGDSIIKVSTAGTVLKVIPFVSGSGPSNVCKGNNNHIWVTEQTSGHVAEIVNTLGSNRGGIGLAGSGGDASKAVFSDGNNGFVMQVPSFSVQPPVVLNSSVDAQVPLSITGTASQSGNLFEAHRGTDSYLGCSIDPTGLIFHAYSLTGGNITADFGGTVSGSYVGASRRLYITNSAAGGYIGATDSDNNNTCHGTGTLSGGTVTISNTSVTANSKIFLQATGGAAGYLTRGTITPGTSFVVTGSGSNTTFDYFIFNSY